MIRSRPPLRMTGGHHRLPAMKIIPSLLFAALLGGTATAGQATFYNDLSHPRFMRIGHKGQKLVVTWLLPGQRVVVNIDENRPGKPILLVEQLNPLNSDQKRAVKAFILPKKREPVFFNMSWFGREY